MYMTSHLNVSTNDIRRYADNVLNIIPEDVADRACDGPVRNWINCNPDNCPNEDQVDRLHYTNKVLSLVTGYSDPFVAAHWFIHGTNSDDATPADCIRSDNFEQAVQMAEDMEHVYL